MEKNLRLTLTQYLTFLTSLFKITSIILLVDAVLILIAQVIPFCLIEWVIVLILFSEVFILVRYKLKKFLKLNLCLVLAIYIVFSITCKPYYHDISFAVKANLPVQPSTVTELKDLCEYLVDKTNETYVISNKNFKENAKTASESFNKLNDIYPFIKTNKTIPKPVVFSKVLSSWEICGFYSCYTLESIINKDMPNIDVPFTMCHELSHISHVMREDEANFVGYLACKYSNDPYFVYSGYYHAMIYATNQYFLYDIDGYRDLINKLRPEVIFDIYIDDIYWQPYRDTKISKSYEKVSDIYLKSNDVKDGVKSYGRMVDLLLAEYRNMT